MRIMHRIGLRGDGGVEEVLSALRIQFRRQDLPGRGYLLYFDIAEDDSRWPEIQRLREEKQASDSPTTTFSRKEILSAEWLLLRPDHFAAYPHPESDWKVATGSGACPICGVGWQQTNPFKIAREFKIGRRHFTSLFWGYPILAVEKVFKEMERQSIIGYECWPLIIAASGQPSNQVSQLFVPHVASAGSVIGDDLIIEDLTCSHSKYLPLKRGQLSVYRRALASDVDFQSTYEWFGSGEKAYREILISSRVARIVVQNRWKGIKLHPVRLVE